MTTTTAPHLAHCANGCGWGAVEEVNGKLLCLRRCLRNRAARRRAGLTSKRRKV